MTYDTLNRKTAMHDPDMGNWSYVCGASGSQQHRPIPGPNLVSGFATMPLNRRVQKDFTTQKALERREIFAPPTTGRPITGRAGCSRWSMRQGRSCSNYDGLGHYHPVGQNAG